MRNRGHPREWFVYPEVSATVKALENIGIQAVAKWKYRFPWNDNNTRKEVYPISYSDLLKLMQNESERVEKERVARKKDSSKMVYYSSFYVYTRKDGPGSALKFALYFSRERYRKNKSAEIKRHRSGQYEKPFLIHENKKEEYSPWHFDQEAYLQKIRLINAELREMNRQATPSEISEKRWKEVVYQGAKYGKMGPVLVYSETKTPKMFIEKDLQKTVEKNIKDAEKRKWKAPPKGYQLGTSDDLSKEHFREMLEMRGYQDIAAAFFGTGHVQVDIPAEIIPTAFMASSENSSLQFNIYKKNRDGYPVARYCFPKENGIETSEEALLVAFQKRI